MSIPYIEKSHDSPGVKHVLLVYLAQTRVYFIVPTKPLAHWPFRWQTAERTEVSPEVILYGLAEELRFLS